MMSLPVYRGPVGWHYGSSSPRQRQCVGIPAVTMNKGLFLPRIDNQFFRSEKRTIPTPKAQRRNGTATVTRREPCVLVKSSDWMTVHRRWSERSFRIFGAKPNSFGKTKFQSRDCRSSCSNGPLRGCSATKIFTIGVPIYYNYRG